MAELKFTNVVSFIYDIEGFDVKKIHIKKLLRLLQSQDKFGIVNQFKNHTNFTKYYIIEQKGFL